jgi:hypothetical protein
MVAVLDNRFVHRSYIPAAGGELLVDWDLWNSEQTVCNGDVTYRAVPRYVRWRYENNRIVGRIAPPESNRKYGWIEVELQRLLTGCVEWRHRNHDKFDCRRRNLSTPFDRDWDSVGDAA